MDDNADIFRQILDNPTFQTVVMDPYLQRVFMQAREAPPGLAAGVDEPSAST
jgi:hypothetical protein